MADQSAGFRENWVTSKWLVSESCVPHPHRYYSSTDRDVSQRRKSVTGLPRDPQLAAFGEVRFGIDVERWTLDTYVHSPHGISRSKLTRLPITSCRYPKTNVRRRYFPPLTVRGATLIMSWQVTNITFLDRCLQTSKPTAIALGVPIYAEHGEQTCR
jgi:hypothetical protein